MAKAAVTSRKDLVYIGTSSRQSVAETILELLRIRLPANQYVLNKTAASQFEIQAVLTIKSNEEDVYLGGNANTVAARHFFNGALAMATEFVAGNRDLIKLIDHEDDEDGGE